MDCRSIFLKLKYPYTKEQVSFHCPTQRSRSTLLFTTFFLLSSFFFSLTTTYAQSTFFTTSDSLNCKRSIGINTLYAGVWSSSLVMLNQTWYKEYPKSSFHTFNDAGEWMQMDKFGHAYTSYQISKSLTSLYRWTGMQPKKAVIAGTIVTLGYQASIEYLDGRSAAWGFSWSDIAANTSGGLLFGIQQYFWNQQYILFKESYSNSPYAKLRPNILGNNLAERYLKDYNGQTYWLSFAPKSILPNAKIPNWLLLSVGYSVDAKIIGDKNSYISSNNETYTASREFLLSLDIDLSKLPIKRRWIKNILRPINAIKIPLPTLRWKNGICYGHGMYF